jgi:hypothetical protein
LKIESGGVIVVLLLTIVTACNPKSEFELTQSDLNEVPDSVIAVEEMIDILCDIHLAEAWVVEQPADSVPNTQKLASYYAGIFLSHGISEEEYKRSFQYYTSKPVLMNHIYNKATEKLNLLESQHRNNATQNKNIKSNE